jgi:NADPH-dependent 2,4-dienoyl-CoA reductase/sulfur reductase-like enzyme/rhodanese-related sulfurtransferase
MLTTMTHAQAHSSKSVDAAEAPLGPNRIVVVGGTAAGMSAAARARRHSEKAEIIVLERQRHVSSASCALPYYVGGEIEDPDELTVHTPETLRASLNLDIRTEHEVTALDAERRVVEVITPNGAEEIGYDELIVAVGTETARPPIPGLEHPRVQTLRTVDDALRVYETLADGHTSEGLPRHWRPLVLGAGFIGVEIAEAFALRDLPVTLVEAASHVLPPLDEETAAVAADALRGLGVDLRVGLTAERIEHGEDDSVIEFSDGSALSTDLIILATGVRPATSLFVAAGIADQRGSLITDERGRTNLPHVWAVGDAVLASDATSGERRMVALAGPANRAGRMVADNIFGFQTRPLPPAVGTAIARIGELTVASTGANRRTLQAAEIPYVTAHLHPRHHASYFPGAEVMHMLLHFHRESGQLLGAQVVGRAGVDKRTDVLATAIRAGMTAIDLVEFDLAYSPPYGSAKDPVNLAGMVGANLLDGTLAPTYAQDLREGDDGRLLLDVRSRGEFASGHLPGAVNIPHTELREHLDEVREMVGDRAVVVICASGLRSYFAHRVLRIAGLDATSLSGGLTTYRHVHGSLSAHEASPRRLAA